MWFRLRSTTHGRCLSAVEGTVININHNNMKSVFIVFNQANSERMEYILDLLSIRGFTMWENVQGRGTVDGRPRQGTHTWPELNSAVMTIIPDEQVAQLLEKVKILDAQNLEIGIRAFVWNIEQSV